MVAENENAEQPTEAAGNEGASSSSPVDDSIETRSDNSADVQAATGTSEAQAANAYPPPLEDRLKKGAKGYLLKIGKLMVMFAILGSLLICFATYMVSSTFSNIFNKLEHPLD